MAETDSTIASEVKLCLESFNILREAQAESNQAHDEIRLRAAVTDSIGRFRVWSGNIGAHQTGRSSLDYRLRDAFYVTVRVVRLLRDLNSQILDALSIIDGSRQPLDNTVDSDSDSCESEVNDDSHQHERLSEIEQIFRDISQIIDSLYRLSMSVRNSNWTNRYTKSATINTSYFEPYDIDHVRQKFPDAQTFNIDRLGTANSRRRQYLKYREEHAAKLAYFKDEHESNIAPSETTASTYGQQIVKEVIAAKDEDIQSETSYATSLGRPTSTRMPRVPKEAANEQPFECQFCHTIAVVKDTHAWRRHVYRDLQPYVCTFQDCAAPDETYESRRQWFNHELQKHRRIWTCNSHCQQTFQTSTQLITHLKKFTSINVTDAQLPALIEMRASPIPKNIESFCPLCNLRVAGTGSLQKHLGRHLEELALFALPNDAAEPDDDTDTSASDYDQEDNVPGIQLESRTEDTDRAPATSPPTDTMNPHGRMIPPNLVEISEDEEDYADIEELIARQREEQLLVPPPLGDISDDENLSSPLEGLTYIQQREPLFVPLHPTNAFKGKDPSALSEMNAEQGDKPRLTGQEAKNDQEDRKGDTAREHSEEGRIPVKDLDSRDFNQEPYDIAEHLQYFVTKTTAEAAAEAAADVATTTKATAKSPPEEKKKPIKFKDAIGRKFNFPFHLCNTWHGMEGLIRQAFLHVNIIGPHVAEGHYDLVGPNGEIILPHVWEAMVEPGWTVTMHMWPMPEPPKAQDPVINIPTPPPPTPGKPSGESKSFTSIPPLLPPSFHSNSTPAVLTTALSIPLFPFTSISGRLFGSDI